MFALVLGQQSGGCEQSLRKLSSAAILVLLAVVPLQLLATMNQADLSLSPSVYFFRIYQHLLYVPVLFGALYVLALFTLWSEGRVDIVLGVLSALMGGYVVLSWSLLAMVLLMLGIFCFVIQQAVLGGRPRASLVAILAVLGALATTIYAQQVFPMGSSDLFSRVGGLGGCLKVVLTIRSGGCSTSRGQVELDQWFAWT